jgi:N-carbamoylputrescine amidase
VHLATIEARGTRTDEKYWFRPGQGLVTFDTRFGRFGCLVCYDRSFPEAWRTLTLQGAEAVFIPVVSYGFREEMFIAELRTMCMENAVFAAAANRGGKEALDFEVTCFGNSCVIDPTGKILARGGSGTAPEIVVGEMDLSEIFRVRVALPLLRDRRPEVYRL